MSLIVELEHIALWTLKKLNFSLKKVVDFGLDMKSETDEF